MSLVDACTILQAAASCPVRLTLLRQRLAHVSSSEVDLQQNQYGGGSLPPGYLVVDDPESSWIDTPDDFEPPLSGPPTRWRSEELTRCRTPVTADDREFDGRQRSQSFEDVVVGDLPQSSAGSVSGAVVVGVGGTYLDLSTVIPPSQSSTSEQWNNEDSAASFCKTQSSPFLETLPEPSTTLLAVSSSHRLAQSADELHTHGRQRDSGYVQDTVTSSSSTGLYPTAVTADTKEDQPLNNDQRGTEPVLSTPPFAEHNNGLSIDAEELVHTNLQQPSAAGFSGGRPLRTTVDDADLGGVERAMRAPERSAAGGLAYYVNLEDHHFRGFPGQLNEGSADGHRISWTLLLVFTAIAR